MPITKTGNIVEVTFTPGGQGSSWVNFYTIDDIYDASQANGWGMEFRNNTYYIPFSIHILDDTYFVIYKSGDTLTLVFCSPTPESYYVYWSTYDSHTKIGYDAYYSEVWPVFMIIDWDIITNSTYRRMGFWGETTMVNTIIHNVHYCYFYNDDPNIVASARNCALYNFQFGLAIDQNVIIENIIKVGGYYGFTANGVKNADNITIVRSNIALLVTGPSCTLKNIKIQQSNTSDVYIRVSNVLYKLISFVDCQVDKAKIGFYSSGSLSAQSDAELKSTTSIYVYDENGNSVSGASVKIYGDEGTLLLDTITDENGVIEGKEIRYFLAYATSTLGVLNGIWTIDYEPLKCVINKTGLLEIELNNIYVSAGNPTNLYVTLPTPIYAEPPDVLEVDEEPTTIAIIEEETE